MAIRSESVPARCRHRSVVDTSFVTIIICGGFGKMVTCFEGIFPLKLCDGICNLNLEKLEGMGNWCAVPPARPLNGSLLREHFIHKKHAHGAIQIQRGRMSRIMKLKP